MKFENHLRGNMGIFLAVNFEQNFFAINVSLPVFDTKIVIDSIT